MRSPMMRFEVMAHWHVGIKNYKLEKQATIGLLFCLVLFNRHFYGIFTV